MFYTKSDILDLIEDNKLIINSLNEKFPFEKNSQIGTGSIDLRIGDSYLKFKKSDYIDNYNTSDDTELFHLAENEDLILQPNEIIIINTLESVFLSSEIGAILTGRSKYSRLGLQIEISQNFIHPGYKNPIPLQLVNLHRDKVMKLQWHSKIAQLIIMDASSPAIYEGDYSKTIINPEPSKAGIDSGNNTEKDFEEPVDNEQIKRFERLKSKFNSQKTTSSKNDDIEFSKYFTKFVGVPDIIKPSSNIRSTGREDLMTFATTELLNNNSTSQIKVLDLCCGYGVFPSHLLKSATDKTSKICYSGIDSTNECISYLKLNYTNHNFNSFDVRLGDITEPLPYQHNSFDVAFLINCLHEIPPETYPEILNNVFKCLKSTGKLIIIDMADLPVNEEESIAITWDKEELKSIFESCGITNSITTSSKSVTVTTSSLTPIKKVDSTKMLSTIKALLILKRKRTIAEFMYLESEGISKLENKKIWLIYCSLITRITLAIQKINDKTKRNGQHK